MYLNYVNDRKQLGYKAVKDTNCGIELVLISDSKILIIRNLYSNSKKKIKRVIIVSGLSILLIFGNATANSNRMDNFSINQNANASIEKVISNQE